MHDPHPYIGLGPYLFAALAYLASAAGAAGWVSFNGAMSPGGWVATFAAGGRVTVIDL